ncbi:hypothetical protein CRG98_002037 [Punica granatum]|uniref:Uncharacterized protein n=1 Tax=Punica granatum TaxID=22663 RepID=A0A2I0LA72_PUNGR|nr:hypothetical protein CRG98_002037 [Punica granatum]
MYVDPNFVSSRSVWMRADHMAWEYPPSLGRMTDTREKELPLLVYYLEIEGFTHLARFDAVNLWKQLIRVRRLLQQNGSQLICVQPIFHSRSSYARKTEIEINATWALQSRELGPTGPEDPKRTEWSSR